MKQKTSKLGMRNFSALLLLASLSTGICTTSQAKTLICHIPPGNPANAHLLNVADASVNAHLDHGDVVGACPASVGAGAGPIVLQGINFTVCDDRAGETGRTVQVKNNGNLKSQDIQCN